MYIIFYFDITIFHKTDDLEEYAQSLLYELIFIPAVIYNTLGLGPDEVVMATRGQ